MDCSKPTCPLCGTDGDSQALESDAVYGGKETDRYYHCKSCDFYYLSPKPSEEELELFYTKNFEKFMDNRSGVDSNWNDEQEHNKISLREVNRRMPHIEKNIIDKDVNILEVGASSGFMLDFIRSHYNKFSLCAVEPSEKFRDYLQQKGHQSYASLSELAIQNDKKFDVILHFFVLAHVYDFKKFIQECLSLLNEGGVMIFETPSATDALYSLYDIPAYKNFYWQVAHIVSFTNISMKYFLDSLSLRYEIIPEQRYDLSNHMIWMQQGRPGGRGVYSNVFSAKLEEEYKNCLEKSWRCDSMFVKIYK